MLLNCCCRFFQSSPGIIYRISILDFSLFGYFFHPSSLLIQTFKNLSRFNHTFFFSFLASLFPQSFSRHLPTQTIILLVQVDVSIIRLVCALCYFHFSDFSFHLYVRVFFVFRFVLSFLLHSAGHLVCVYVSYVLHYSSPHVSHYCTCICTYLSVSLSILLVHHHTCIRIMLLCSI